MCWMENNIVQNQQDESYNPSTVMSDEIPDEAILPTEPTDSDNFGVESDTDGRL